MQLHGSVSSRHPGGTIAFPPSPYSSSHSILQSWSSFGVLRTASVQHWSLPLRTPGAYIGINQLTINYEWFCDFGGVTFKWATKQFNIVMFTVFCPSVASNINRDIHSIIPPPPAPPTFVPFFLKSHSPTLWECSTQNENANHSCRWGAGSFLSLGLLEHFPPRVQGNVAL